MMIVSLGLLVLTAISARSVSSDCSSKYLSLDDLPDHFFRTTKGNRLQHVFNAYERVNTKGKYNYHGLTYDDINVDVNGNIVFGSKLAPRYPVSGVRYSLDMVAVFWAGTDIRYCGNVFWRETNKRKPRNRFRKMVDDVFGVEFRPNYVFIVTYVNVDEWWSPCCTASIGDKRAVGSEGDADWEEADVSDGTVRDTRAVRPGEAEGKAGTLERPEAAARSDEKLSVPHGLNSYQIVLATDGFKTYALLNYADPIGWTDAPFSMAGFWTDYNDKSYRYKKSFMSAINTLPDQGTTTASNTLPGGQYIFRVDQFPSPFIYDPDTSPKFMRWP